MIQRHDLAPSVDASTWNHYYSAELPRTRFADLRQSVESVCVESIWRDGTFSWSSGYDLVVPGKHEYEISFSNQKRQLTDQSSYTFHWHRRLSNLSYKYSVYRSLSIARGKMLTAWSRSRISSFQRYSWRWETNGRDGNQRSSWISPARGGSCWMEPMTGISWEDLLEDHSNRTSSSVFGTGCARTTV